MLKLPSQVSQTPRQQKYCGDRVELLDHAVQRCQAKYTQNISISQRSSTYARSAVWIVEKSETDYVKARDTWMLFTRLIICPHSFIGHKYSSEVTAGRNVLLFQFCDGAHFPSVSLYPKRSKYQAHGAPFYTIVQKRCCALGFRLLSCLVLSCCCCLVRVSELGKKTCLWCRTGPVCLPQSFLFTFLLSLCFGSLMLQDHCSVTKR